MNGLDLSTMLPLITLVSSGILMLLLSLWKGLAPRAAAGIAVLLWVFGGFIPVFTLWQSTLDASPKPSLIQFDAFTLFILGLICSLGLLTSLMVPAYFAKKEREGAEIHALFFFAATGMVVWVGATHMLTVFVGLELMSIVFYILTGYLRDHERGVEASLKYFLLGSLSSAFILFGMALIYGATRSLAFSGIASGLLVYKQASPLLAAGFILFSVGYLFKMAIIPFHFWAPDVYQGAPTPVSAFMAVGGKVAALAALLRFLSMVILHSQSANAIMLSHRWNRLWLILAMLTLFVGATVALTQRYAKRLLAYSSVVHAGFMALALALIPVVASDIQRALFETLLFYLVAYTFMNVGAFALVAMVERKENIDEPLLSLAGLGVTRPFLGVSMAVFMFSLAGIPPSSGFLAKFYVFLNIIRSGHYTVATFGILAAVIATYYYLKVTVMLYFPGDLPSMEPAPKSTPIQSLVLLVTMAVTLVLGVYPGLVNGFISQAVAIFFQGAS